MDPRLYSGPDGLNVAYAFNDGTHELDPSWQQEFPHLAPYIQTGVPFARSPAFVRPPNDFLPAPVQNEQGLQAHAEIQTREREDAHLRMKNTRNEAIADMRRIRDETVTRLHEDMTDAIVRFQSDANDTIATFGNDPVDTTSIKRGTMAGSQKSTNLRIRAKDAVIEQLRHERTQRTRAKEEDIARLKKKMDDKMRTKDEAMEKLRTEQKDQLRVKEAAVQQYKIDMTSQLRGKDAAIEAFQKDFDAQLQAKDVAMKRLWKHMEEQLRGKDEVIKQLEDGLADTIERAQSNEATFKQLQQEISSQADDEDADRGQSPTNLHQQLERIKNLVSGLTLASDAKGEGSRKRKLSAMIASPSNTTAPPALILGLDDLVNVESAAQVSRTPVPPLEYSAGYLNQAGKWCPVSVRNLPRSLFPAINAVLLKLGSRRDDLSKENTDCLNMIAQNSESQNSIADQNKAACRSCTEAGKPCIRFVDEELCVVPVPTVLRGGTGPADLEFWIRP